MRARRSRSRWAAARCRTTSSYAISANWGGYHGTNAFGATALVRISDNIVLNGGVGVGLTKGDVGGRVGVTFAW